LGVSKSDSCDPCALSDRCRSFQSVAVNTHYRYAQCACCVSAITMTSPAGDDNPFRDPSLALTQPQPPQSFDGNRDQLQVPDTLAVGRDASLTLGTDSLIVLGASHSAYRERMLTCDR
jgi:hypothetical protein